jgi:hypothetical protein
MKFNKWTLGLAAIGAVSLASVAKAEETPSMVKTLVSGTTISGEVDTSFEWAVDPAHETFAVGGLFGGYSSHSGSSYSPVGIPFRANKQDGFNLNVVEVNIEKPMDEMPWSSGYKVQLLFGPDAVGYNPSANGAGGQFAGGTGSDFAIKQAYVTMRVPVGNGIDLKMGVFDTIIGYEVFEAGNNPNFSRSWGYAIEPTQHTGLLASYKINDNISVSAGVANTLSAGINTRNNKQGRNSYMEKTGLASITLTAPQSWGWLSGASLNGGLVYGFNGVASDAINLYLGLTIPTPIKGLAFGAAFDYLSYSRWYINEESTYDYSYACCCCDNNYYNDYYTVTSSHGRESVEAYSLAGYGTWQVTEKLGFNLRGEYVHGEYKDSGAAYTDSYDYCTDWSSYGDTYFYNNHGDVDLFAVTATLQYNLWANVISRVEARYDTACYSGGSSQDQFSIYLNIIYKF